VEDVAFGSWRPIRRLITRRSIAYAARHQDALGDLFGEVLELCARAGAVWVGVIALDATRMRANAADSTNRS
jgi:hypothetical protein